MLGMEYFDRYSCSFSVFGLGVLMDDFVDLLLIDNGEGKCFIDLGYSDYCIFFYFGCLNYDYKGCYLFFVVFCQDGYLFLLGDNCWGFFLGVFVGWIFG